MMLFGNARRIASMRQRFVAPNLTAGNAPEE
jgi:hypothetical protein